jgi:hypothetical protein
VKDPPAKGPDPHAPPFPQGAPRRPARIALSKDQDKKLAATVKITARDAAGNTGTTSKKLNLKC